MKNEWPLDYWVIAPSGLCVAKLAFRDDALLLIEACKENLRVYLSGEYKILYKGEEEE